MIVSGGLGSAERARRAYRDSRADAVMIARGALGNPWIFAELTGSEGGPGPEEIEAELRWILDRAEEHWGSRRAALNLRKFYPRYVDGWGSPAPKPTVSSAPTASIRCVLLSGAPEPASL